MKHEDPLSITFWQYNNIVPIIASVLSAAITVGAVYVNMVRRMDRMEYEIQQMRKEVSALTDTMNKYLEIRAENQDKMSGYVYKVENLESCARQMCSWYK